MVLPETGIRFVGSVFRAHNTEWAWDPLSGEGARRHGGRFNAVGQPALYAAMREVGTIREASSLGRPMQPLTLCEYAVDCTCLFDSQSTETLLAEERSLEDFSCPNWNKEM